RGVGRHRIDLLVLERVPVARVDEEIAVLPHPAHGFLETTRDALGTGIRVVSEIAHVEAAVGPHEVHLGIDDPADARPLAHVLPPARAAAGAAAPGRASSASYAFIAPLPDAGSPDTSGPPSPPAAPPPAPRPPCNRSYPARARNRLRRSPPARPSPRSAGSSRP